MFDLKLIKTISISLIFILITVVNANAQSPVEFKKSTIEIKTNKGDYTFLVELALSPSQKSYGLMYRQSMPENHGMLFIYDKPQVATMWMKNTYIPLDMVFIKSDGIIENIIQRTTPHSLDVLSATNKVRSVLELNAGTISKLGIKAGDEVIHDIFVNRNK